MNTLLVALTTACLIFLIGVPKEVTAEDKSFKVGNKSIFMKKDKVLTKQWKEVKTKYPKVAMELLRRDALIHQIAQLTLWQRERSQEYTAIQTNLCYLYERFNLASSSGCQIVTVRIGDIGSCFEPQPSQGGGYEMPSADEAETCVQREMSPQ